MFFFALPEDSQLPQQPAAKPSGRLKLIQNYLTLIKKLYICLFDSVVKIVSNSRSSSMIRAVAVQVTGTAFSVLNTWQLATTWLQRCVGCR